MFQSTVRLLSRRRVSTLAAVTVLCTSGAMLSATPSSAATLSPAHPAQTSSGLFTQTTTVNVPATTPPTGSGMPGVDTGIDLAPGEHATITATGTATCHVGNPPDPTCGNLNANGDGDRSTATSPPYLDPDAPAWSLDGEVGSGPLTFIGTGPTTVQGPGELRLGYNDQLGDYGDNGGGFTVSIQTCTLYALPILGPTLCSLLSPSAG